MTLSGRLSLFVALIVAGVIAGAAYLEMRAFEGDIERDLVDAGQSGARSAADSLSERTPPLDPLDIRDALHDLVEADPLLDAIAVIEADDSGRLRVLTSTSTEEESDVLDLAGRAIATGTSVSARSLNAMLFASPVPQQKRYAVTVTVGLETLLQADAHGLRVALGFALPSIVLITLFVHLTVRRFVGQPLRAILRTMEDTGSGNLAVRATVMRPDELGTIATGLNQMLDQLEGFNRSLQARVEAATRDLSLRNAELAASQQQLLAAHDSLARAERVAALGQVAANVAHQAGTPLNLVSGYVQMIRDDPRTDDRTRARLQTVDTQIQQVTRVLRTMLDHARQPPGFEVVALADIVERVREVAEPLLSRSHIRLQTSVARDLPPIRADVTQLEMALLNLVNNALDAMPGGGTLSIAATALSGAIRVEVADTGTGIAPEIMEHLFEPWVTTKPTGQGTGLGLAIVRDVIRTHGGSITAHNRAQGAVFVVDLRASHSGEESS